MLDWMVIWFVPNFGFVSNFLEDRYFQVWIGDTFEVRKEPEMGLLKESLLSVAL